MMRKLFLYGLLLVLCFNTIACKHQKPADKITSGIDTYSHDKTTSLFQGLPVGRFEKVIDSLHIQIIDVRQPEEYEQEHLKNAININYDDVNLIGLLDKLDKTKAYGIYCQSGVRSSLVLTKMIDAKFQKVFMLKGGLEVWKSQHKPTISKQ